MLQARKHLIDEKEASSSKRLKADRSQSHIIVKGARENNLKGISLAIPKKQIVAFTGVSGSGKSSVVFDTIYAESNRQLVDTFSAFARSRLPKVDRPNVASIENLSTAIVIDQKRFGSNNRSTVGTITEIHTFLRLLFSRCGDPHIGGGMCEKCKGIGEETTIDIDQLLDKELSLNEGAILHPHFKTSGWTFRSIAQAGFVDPDKKLKDFTAEEMDIFLNSEKVAWKHSSGITLHFEGLLSILKRRFLSMDDERRREKVSHLLRAVSCTECKGNRLNAKASSVKVFGKTIVELSTMELTDLLAFLGQIPLDEISEPIVTPILERLTILCEIGVGYLNLMRNTASLSGGESQRVKMAKQFGCTLVDMLYIMDEPSIGLHPRDVHKLVDTIKALRYKGNSVLVVEHDTTVMENADWIVDIGPNAGAGGGEIVFEGTPRQLLESKCLTGKYLRESKKKKAQQFQRRPLTNGFFTIANATCHNLKDVTVNIPKGVLVCLTGVAGSGKSSLIHYEFTKRFPQSILVTQNAVTANSRSNPATYTGVFDLIRKLFAKETKQDVGMFSFNSKGACPECKGSGVLNVEMIFLADASVRCNVCHGHRYSEEALEFTYKKQSIVDVLNMTVSEALIFFKKDKAIHSRLAVIEKVGLGYLKLGEPLNHLSGGECQRIKLSTELRKKGNIYILDEPTTGLHMADIEKLLAILQELVDAGNSVIVIEHNLDVVVHADWVVDLGPEGGGAGGQIIAEGTPEQIAMVEHSFTGQFLKSMLF